MYLELTYVYIHLFLRQVFPGGGSKAISSRRDLYHKKVWKMAKIRHKKKKLLTKKCLLKGNILRVIAIHDHVINILTYNEARQLGLLVLPQIEALLAI